MDNDADESPLSVAKAVASTLEECYAQMDQLKSRADTLSLAVRLMMVDLMYGRDTKLSDAFDWNHGLGDAVLLHCGMSPKVLCNISDAVGMHRLSDVHAQDPVLESSMSPRQAEAIRKFRDAAVMGMRLAHEARRCIQWADSFKKATQ
jgi:hypothetical protein